MVRSFARTTWDVRGFHSNSEMFVAADRILKRACLLTEAFVSLHPPSTASASRRSSAAAKKGTVPRLVCMTTEFTCTETLFCDVLAFSTQRTMPAEMATRILDGKVHEVHLDVVECGTAQGSSTAKLSFVVGLAERTINRTILKQCHLKS